MSAISSGDARQSRLRPQPPTLLLPSISACIRCGAIPASASGYLDVGAAGLVLRVKQKAEGR
jgi:hypothetical protein